MRGFFHLLYHQFAWTYDGFSQLVSLGMWQEWVLATLPYIRGPHVLELGPGPGHIQQALGRLGINSVALEASPQMARLAYLRTTKNMKTMKMVNGYAQFMPFADSSFQQVLATFPTDYIFQVNTALEIWRVLVSGGDCYILPAAWITATSFPFRWASHLFEITGQVPSDLPDWTGPFTQAGFSAELIPVELPRSHLILIHAKKPPTTN